MKSMASLFCLTLTSLMSGAFAMAPASHDTKQDASKQTNYVHLDFKGKKINHNPGLARCVMDKQTGLVWELKTNDDSVHNQEKDYRWGGVGAEKTGTGFFDDWNPLLEQTKKEKLCGFKDWRVPTIDELKSLVINNQQGLTIDTHYFFDTKDSPYWSSSAYANYPEHAQTVHFGNGNSYYYNGYRGNRLPLRLVRGKLKSPKN